jgi:AbrB family looped-hinge helix DNA binding protein
MKVTSKGQVTIPLSIREQTGIVPGCEVAFSVERGRIYVHKTADSNRGKALIGKMAGRGSVQMSTDEILSLTRGDG